MAGAGSSFIDVGANLLDDMFQGRYNGSSQKHPPDLEHVLARAWDAGMTHIIITAGNLDEARRALELAESDERLFSTVGVHPTRCGEFAKNEEGGAEPYLDALMELARDGQKSGKVVAIGECGLDYDRLHFCDKPEQMEGFERQFALAKETGLPMFLVRAGGGGGWMVSIDVNAQYTIVLLSTLSLLLPSTAFTNQHNRNTGDDFVTMIRKHRHEFSQGVVHRYVKEGGKLLCFFLCFGLKRIRSLPPPPSTASRAPPRRLRPSWRRRACTLG